MFTYFNNKTHMLSLTGVRLHKLNANLVKFHFDMSMFAPIFINNFDNSLIW